MSEVEELAVWLRERPESIRVLAERFPPGCTVKAREGVVLMAPAPGVEGYVVSYLEPTPDNMAGTIRVAAPLSRQIESPHTGWVGKKGELIGGECSPLELDVVRFVRLEDTEIDGAWVKAALAGEET